MPTKVAFAVLALAATTLAGCAGTEEDTAAPAITPSSAPAGNGVAELSADEIMAKARAAAKAAKSVHIAGTMYDSDEVMKFDLKSDGANFLAAMTMNGNAKVEMLQVDGTKYFRPNEAFWVMSTNAAQGKLIAKAYGGKWISGADKDKSFDEMFGMGDVDQLLTPDGTLSKGEPKEIDGKPAIGLKDSSDKSSTMYIATEGEPYPLQLAGEKGTALNFTQYGEKFPEIATPAAGKIDKMK